MRRSPEATLERGLIPLLFVVAMLATLVPTPALAGEGSSVQNYSTGSSGYVLPCDRLVKAGPVQEYVGGACFPLNGSQKIPASLTIRDAAGLPGWFEYRIIYRNPIPGGPPWVGVDYGSNCGTFLSLDWLPPPDYGYPIYLQVQLKQSLDDSTYCPKGLYTTGSITFSYTT